MTEIINRQVHTITGLISKIAMHLNSFSLGKSILERIVNMMNIFTAGKGATISFCHSDNTVLLSTKDKSNITISDLCKSVTPPCNLSLLLFNGHLQTIWSAIKQKDLHIIYKRKIFEVDDHRYAGSFAVDFVVHHNSVKREDLPERTTFYSNSELEDLDRGSSDQKPILITLHGLSGGSHELYLREVLGPMVKERDWEACVVNSRGCAMSKITTPVLFNARATWDVRQAISWLSEKYPNRPLFAVGYSLGANILTNVKSTLFSKRIELRD